jgi:hypothetical protein
MAWNGNKCAKKGESDHLMDHVLSGAAGGTIVGLLTKIRKGKAVKHKLPKEGTPEFNALVKEGMFIIKTLIISTFIGMVVSLIQCLRKLY